VEHEVIIHGYGANLAFVDFTAEDTAEEAVAHPTLTVLLRRVNHLRRNCGVYL
jgi:hypothetical protein